MTHEIDQTPENITIALVDDQALVRQGIASLISLHPEFTVCWQAENGQDALTRLNETPVDVVLMDNRMPVLSGVDTLKQLRQTDQQTKVIILTTFDEPGAFIAAMQAGANGFLLKDVDLEKLHQAIITVYQGNILAEPVLLNQLSEAQLATFADNEITPLTDRELEILKLMAGGYSNREIAEAIFLAEGTVKNHVSNVLAKLNTRDRTRAVLKAMSAKLI